MMCGQTEQRGDYAVYSLFNRLRLYCEWLKPIAVLLYTGTFHLLLRPRLGCIMAKYCDVSVCLSVHRRIFGARYLWPWLWRRCDVLLVLWMSSYLHILDHNMEVCRSIRLHRMTSLSCYVHDNAFAAKPLRRIGCVEKKD